MQSYIMSESGYKIDLEKVVRLIIVQIILRFSEMVKIKDRNTGNVEIRQT